MNDRKQHVIKAAHQLFIEKGFQSTSIQEILDESGISKGTFYNYFSSKNELIMAIFKSINSNLEKDRNSLLIGQDPADIEIFIKQIELHLRTNRKNKLITLFEEVMVSNDPELKRYMKQEHLRILYWLYTRLIDIFGEEKKNYLLDCAIMFIGILQHTFRYSYMAYEAEYNMQKIIRYCVERLITIVKDTVEKDEQLIPPELLEQWVPELTQSKKTFQQEFCTTISKLKKELPSTCNSDKTIELLEFLQEELLESKHPRKFIIESVLSSLKNDETIDCQQNVKSLFSLIENYMKELPVHD